MSSAVCTIFEGNYHYGVAALANSLERNGFKGSLYAGYKGELPKWASYATKNPEIGWPGAQTLVVSDHLKLHFLPITTDHHLTNYKPNFLLRIWEDIAVRDVNIFYFDPDIVVCRPWYVYEEWVACGIALCEDINSPLPEHHPRRKAWRAYFKNYGILLAFKDPIYANGGFIGLNLKDKHFLTIWNEVQEKMGIEIGGLDRSIFHSPDNLQKAGGAFDPFDKTDQDALNAAIEASSASISFICKEGMGFKHGAHLMQHAVGAPKPWICNPLRQAVLGRPPRAAERFFWQYLNGPIMVRSRASIKMKQVQLIIAILIGRFYRRN